MRWAHQTDETLGVRIAIYSQPMLLFLLVIADKQAAKTVHPTRMFSQTALLLATIIALARDELILLDRVVASFLLFVTSSASEGFTLVFVPK
jgi:hypothetical protein